MKIRSLDIADFRGIEKMHLDFFERTTVLVGINGVGKSTILDALAILLSQLTWRINERPLKARQISPDDIRIDTNFSRLEVAVDVIDEPQARTWVVARNRKGGKHPEERSSNLEKLNEVASLLAARIEHNKAQNTPVNLPLAVYYDVHRAVVDTPMRVREKLEDSAYEAYSDALDHGGADFYRFFIWFRNREDFENEQRVDNPDFRDRGLSAVRMAIESFTQFKNLRVRRKPLRMQVTKGNLDLNVAQLSDGEKCMLALVGDLARRLSLLNTGGVDPLQGEGVVLIDEIDLHLHPKWQRSVVASLERTFPNCQFIVTTHSPQILGELKPRSIMLLKDAIFVGFPERSFGLNSNQVLDEVMTGSRSQNEEVSAAIEKIRIALDEERISDAEILIKELKLRVNSIPDVLELEGAVESLRWLGEEES